MIVVCRSHSGVGAFDTDVKRAATAIAMMWLLRVQAVSLLDCSGEEIQSTRNVLIQKEFSAFRTLKFLFP